MNNAAKNFDILATSSSVLHNYFDSLYEQNYFSDPYPAKILDLSAKPLFPRTIVFSARAKKRIYIETLRIVLLA